MSDSTNMEISTTEYATRAKKLLKLALNLRDIGAETDFDLPRIVVIGGQSAGKSSLVEAVTGIRVPRDSGTCTRCPMECNMNDSTGDWSCKISLRFVYDKDVALATPRVVDFGPPLTDKSDVEIALRKAQVAILNPHRSPETFLSMTNDELKYYRTDEAFEEGTEKFSHNTVRIDIYDATCAPLTFVDLPGLIQNEEGEVVNMVIDLATRQIQGNSLILVAVPMTDDMRNQKAMRLARDADPGKVRTIGVLTKPDAVGAGAIGSKEAWTAILEGRSDELRLGYYCVRLADDEERSMNLSRTETQDLARMFFQTTSPWNTIADRSRFGIPSLVKALSRHLTDLLDEILPTLKAQAQRKIDECRKELELLPAPLMHEPSAEILEMINKFCGELKEAVYGKGNFKLFIQQNQASYRAFKIKIRSTAPDFRPVENVSKCAAISDVEESDEIGAHNFTNATPYDLYGVRRVIKESIAWELPHNIPFDAKSRLILECLERWDAPAFECLSSVSTRLYSYLHEKNQEQFKRFPKLQAYIWQLIEAHFNSRHELSQQAVQVTLAMEKSPLYTQNHHYLDSVRDKWLSKYRERRKNPIPPPPPPVPVPAPSPAARRPAAFDHRLYPSSVGVAAHMEEEVSPLDEALSALARLGYRGLTETDLTRLSPPDSFEEELIVMADVRAYFQVAYKRIIDNLPLTIEHALNQSLANSLQFVLVDSLALGSADASARLKELVAEESSISMKRDALTTKIAKLKGILDEFTRFGV
ncbi:hypothetical protein BD410DRAFT_790079 [Rickenella mellea]|uniref:P-loop containing nucleoside triphosphate hydrolase protein n=1 Tax=Rickenella mellea TaxID=50990 RepID=A0A4Y7Q033_9AGAM|nr:hypothetical protein BD410DRAFT_790079 [Rickenella mellea]